MLDADDVVLNAALILLAYLYAGNVMQTVLWDRSPRAWVEIGLMTAFAILAVLALVWVRITAGATPPFDQAASSAVIRASASWSALSSTGISPT